jgi:hypothetical protein
MMPNRLGLTIIAPNQNFIHLWPAAKIDDFLDKTIYESF